MSGWGRMHPRIDPIRHGEVSLAARWRLPAAADDGQVPLVILMHGLLDSMEAPVIRALADSLAERGIASLRFDFHGHGRSSGRFEDMTVPAEVDDALTVLDLAQSDARFSTISVVGHSQGGVVASLLGGRVGDRIASMVLLAPPHGVAGAALRGDILGNRFDPTDPPDSLVLHPWGGARLGREYLVTTQSLDIDAALARFPGPVCIIQGTRDEIVDPGSAEAYAAVAQDAEVHMVSGQDHEFLAGPKWIAEIAADFLARHA
ncbi:alpha/beta hydrolase family protein [Demequina zhanjiangensis]|uniref:Alpha/beta fold hydrolase n=1 Tax=Demequina zhanjiangensis TaxID=3051659 RepID=A0ABT8G0B5_9MICO|nr:alpha/beta fold hydrolase [Demequina sp. SYSU T00b26]MDN4472586.1 alpha/beta fold hydrolase [Demequina sp. SYSU T00b26]